MGLEPQDPITVPAEERFQAERLERLLASGHPALVSPSGEKIELPDTIYAVLRKVVELMAHGEAVTLIRDNEVVTTQQAADILGMSRPFFIKLLDTGVMAYHRVGNQRRVYLRNVLAFSRKREVERQAALDQLTRQAFELGLYDRDEMPVGGQDV